jgi:two-component system, OmpR family, sensor histidine kinase BaeS
LAVARKIVERHGGRISVHSEGHGFGCTFRFNLPFVPEEPT